MQRLREHLAESGMTYWQHLCHSVRQSSRLIWIAILSIIHGVLPWLFAASGPRGVYSIYREIRRLHHVQRIFRQHDTES